uniref:DNA-directed RNA polymerase RBP11-like dimerisation domain-containing protein n=1 Tax=Corethron hystrix TaxID=216773 RepID=A0A7S1BWM0_9STRA|mmetsp:Transcript_4893/g.9704  ORF Transcript_4893/g.9704 Transcript_4893/m.9704 type:complete len:152 (+) Transcript_4893:224-679(+)
MSVNEVRKPTAPIEFEIRNTNNSTDPLSSTSATFVLGNEDHTLGNALRHILLERTDVRFAGYAVPHPSEPVVQVRVQTKPRKIGEQPKAIEVLKSASQTLSDVCDLLTQKIEEAIPEVQAERAMFSQEEDADEEVDDYANEDGVYDEGEGL